MSALLRVSVSGNRALLGYDLLAERPKKTERLLI